MSSSFDHQYFNASSPRKSQSLGSVRCQTILYKAVFEHFKEFPMIAALLLASKSFQNSSFGANFLVNFRINGHTAKFHRTVLSPSSCFSLQFVPSLYIEPGINFLAGDVAHGVADFVTELVNTKYLRLQLRSLTLYHARRRSIMSFFGDTSIQWDHLSNLSLHQSEVYDDEVGAITKAASHLKVVDLGFCAFVTDDALPHIASSLSEITSLKLKNNSGITDAGLESISNIMSPSLVALDLASCTSITDAGLAHLSAFANLSNLNLSFCDRITDAGLEHISTLSRLTWFDLSGCRDITDIGVDHVSKCSRMTQLDLAGCNKITDVGIQHISKLSNMSNLNLTECIEITDVGFVHLSKLRRLASLDVFWCKKISPAAVKEFLEACPNCKVYK